MTTTDVLAARRQAELAVEILRRCEGLDATREELKHALSVASTAVEQSISVDLMRAAVHTALTPRK